MLKQLDGKLINPTERILARQNLTEYEERLTGLAKANILKKNAERASGVKVSEGAHTIENRLDMCRELGAQKEVKERAERERMGTEPKPPRVIPDVLNSKGEIRQCNEGKYDFTLDESDPTNILFELSVPRFLDTTHLSVDVNPKYVRVIAKEKLTQLRLPEEIIVTTSTVLRSKTTGWLKITMPRLIPKKEMRRRGEAAAIEPLKEQNVKLVKKGGVDVAHITSKRETHIKERCSDEHPEVPPLEPIPL